MAVYEKAIEFGPRNPSGTKASRGAKGSSRGIQERKSLLRNYFRLSDQS
jgi:hypothetical protein